MPRNADAKIKIYRHVLRPLMKSISENSRLDIDVIATIITAIGEAIPADTAASPRIKPPTMLKELPIFDGTRISPSLNISKMVTRIIISTTIENGSILTWLDKDIRSCNGMMSLLNEVTAMYIAGV